MTTAADNDAARVANAIARIFASPEAGQRAGELRALFAETLDFAPHHGIMPLPPDGRRPAAAHRIAGRDGIAVAYLAFAGPGPTRINQSDARSAVRAIASHTGHDPLLLISNGPNDRLEFVWPLPAGDREELRRIIISRQMPQRPAPQLIGDLYRLTRETGSVHEALHRIFSDDAVTRPVIPENPTDIFTPHLEPLRRLYDELRPEPATQTKRELWLSMLRGSGCAPENPAAENDLFLSHTLLVTIARAVIATMSPWERPEDPAHVMAEGFASWPQCRDEHGPTHPAGVQWTRDVFHTARTYDWRPRTRDVLRNIYQDLIPQAQRKAFGEYYTPDWLAGMLADRIIDDAWLQRAINRYLRSHDAPAGAGILYPACGSGTFLYHAALRILNSAALQESGATPTEQADFIARMVNGIDIHPIAAEISRATLMRALPAPPSGGSDALQIYQGDSLIYTHRGIQLANTEGLPWHTLESRAGRYLRIPTQWAARPGFGPKVLRYVTAANLDQPHPPPDTLDGLLESDRQTLLQTYQTLREVIRAEGNSVWAWYIFNSVSPAALKERKVDRILANPPWVRMSHIQVESRKRELERLIGNLNLWPGGRANTGFDIGGLFVIRCREMYLRPDADNRVAWVLNSAAIKGSNWERVRQESRPYNEEFLDFSPLDEAPFTGAKSCALLQGQAPAGGPAQTRMVNRPGHKVRRADNPAALVNAEIVAKPAGFPAQPSAYFTGNRPDFRNGATLVPRSLIEIHNVQPQEKGNVSFITDGSRHEPWKNFNGRPGIVPAEYVSDAMLADDMLAFATKEQLSKIIIPLTANRELDARRDKNEYWRQAEQDYRNNRGLGVNTPQTLWDNINFQGKLIAQIGANRTGNAPTKVVYNSSGQTLRGVRVMPGCIVGHQNYWLLCRTTDEAAYLTAILNADCLQQAYQDSRKSDRDFLHHIWRAVPIPRYDARNRHHRELASLCADAERAAAAVRDGLPADTGQIKLCEAIRQSLRAKGIAALIDQQVRAILPHHTTPPP